MSIEFPAEEMKIELENVVLAIVNDRVSQLPSALLKINVFINVEAQETVPDSFRNIFLTKAIEALDAFSSKKAVSNFCFVFFIFML